MNEPVRCRACDRRCEAEQAPALAWVCETRNGGGRAWMCPACARDHLRAIEAKLTDDWW